MSVEDLTVENTVLLVISVVMQDKIFLFRLKMTLAKKRHEK